MFKTRFKITARERHKALPPITSLGIALVCALGLYGPGGQALALEVEDELRQLLKTAIEKTEGFSDRYAAEVWLVDMSGRLEKRLPDAKQRLELLRILHQEAHRASLRPELVLAVIQVESNFDRFAISSAGARGLMQVMPFWKKEIGRPEDNLMHVRTNLRYGCTILAYYLKKERGDLIRALARYNGSLGKTWYPERVMLTWEKNWFVDNS